MRTCWLVDREKCESCIHIGVTVPPGPYILKAHHFIDRIMSILSRKAVIVLGLLVSLLGIGATAAPAFACGGSCPPPSSSSLSTTIYCNNGGTWSACTSTQLGGINTAIEDKASLALSSPDSVSLGTVSFYVFSCPSSTVTNCYVAGDDGCLPVIFALGSLVVPTKVWTDSSNAYTVGSGNVGSTVVYTSSQPSFSGTPGNYFFYVVYSGSISEGYPPASACEPFQTTTHTFPPPPTGAPEFPAGMALLMALAIPALLLVRSRSKVITA